MKKKHQKLNFLFLIFFISIFLNGSFIFAQEEEITYWLDMSLSELMNLEVTVASKTSENIIDAPGIITVISKKEIKSFAEDDLGEILNRVVSSSYLSANILTDNLVDFRGQSFTPYNNHTLFLLNGRPLRDPITGGLNATLLTSFPINIIERIEIIRGPGSVLYGSCAYSGVVNIITHTLETDGVHAGANMSYGINNTLKYDAHATFKEKEIMATVGFKNFKTEGEEFSFIDYLGVDTSHNFWKNGNGIYTNIIYKNFSFSGTILDYRPYALGGVDNSWSIDWGDKEQHTSYFSDFGYSHDFTKNISSNFNISSNKHVWHTDYGKVMEANDLMGEFNLRFSPNQKTNILLGGTIGKQEHQSDYFFEGSQNYQSLYLHADYRIFISLKLVAGLQFNKIEGINGNFSPRLGAIYNITSSIGFKALYGQAFRKGYPLETSFNIPQLLGNNKLKPELITTYETQLFYNIEKYHFSVTAYYSKMKDIIYRTMYNDQGYLMYDNGPTHNFFGLEFESKINLSENILLLMSANYQENVGDSINSNNQGEVIKNTTLHPNFMAKGGIIYTNKIWNIGVYNSYFGKPKKVVDINPDAAIVNKEASNYNLLSAKISYNLSPLFNINYRVKFWISGQNLLAKDIRYPEFTSNGVNTLIPLRTSFTLMAGIKLEF